MFMKSTLFKMIPIACGSLLFLFSYSVHAQADNPRDSIELTTLYKAFEIVNDPEIKYLLEMSIFNEARKNSSAMVNRYQSSIDRLNLHILYKYVDQSRLRYADSLSAKFKSQNTIFPSLAMVLQSKEIDTRSYDQLAEQLSEDNFSNAKSAFLVKLLEDAGCSNLKELKTILTYNENIAHIKSKSPDLLNDLFQNKHHVSDQRSLVRGGENGGSGDFTNVAVGMSRFLADRAMQELNESFFMMMEKQMKKNIQLAYFFPATKDYLTQVRDQQRFINLDYIKNYFEKDIKHFPLNFYRFKDQFMLGKDSIAGRKVEGSFSVNIKNSLSGRWIDLGLDAMNNSNWGTSPIHLINGLVHSKKAEELYDMLHTERMLVKIIEGRNNSKQLVDKSGKKENSDFLVNLAELLNCSSKVNTTYHQSCSDEKCTYRDFVRKALIYDGKATAENVKQLIKLKDKIVGTLQISELLNLADFKEACASLLRYKLNSYLILDSIINSTNNIRVDIRSKWKNYVNDSLSNLPLDSLVEKAIELDNFLTAKFKVGELTDSNYISISDAVGLNNVTKITSNTVDSLIKVRVEKVPNYKETVPYKKLLVMDYYCELLDKSTGDKFRDEIYKKTNSKDNIVKQFNLYNVLKLVDLISTQLVDHRKDNLWKGIVEVDSIINDEIAFGKFIEELQIINQNVKTYDIQFFRDDHTRLALNELLDNNLNNSRLKERGVDKIDLFRKFINDIYGTYADLNNLLTKVKDKNTESDRLTHLNQIFSTIEDLMEVTTEYFYYYSGRDIKFDPGVVFNTIGPCINFAHNIRKKDYHLAIEDVLLILGNFAGKNTDIQTNKSYNKFLTKMSTYGNVVAKVAVAENSDQVKAAIESSVLPVGSSRMKRYAEFSITLNAYVGVFGGKAMYKERVDGQVLNRSLTTFGMTAPIGLGFNFGDLRIKGARTAISLNAQIFDLGTLVNFYMKHGDEAMLPESTKIRFRDIIAPGFTAAWSLGNTPLSLIGGVQFIPNLNQMGIIEGEQKFQSLAWRAQVGLAIDIPLYNIKVWNK